MPYALHVSKDCNLHEGGAAPPMQDARSALSQRKGNSLPCCRSTTPHSHSVRVHLSDLENSLVTARMCSSVCRAGDMGGTAGQARPGACKALPRLPGRGGTEPNQALRKPRCSCHASAVSHRRAALCKHITSCQSLLLPRRRVWCRALCMPQCHMLRTECLSTAPHKLPGASPTAQEVLMRHPPSPSRSHSPPPKPVAGISCPWLPP